MKKQCHFAYPILRPIYPNGPKMLPVVEYFVLKGKKIFLLI